MDAIKFSCLLGSFLWYVMKEPQATEKNMKRWIVRCEKDRESINCNSTHALMLSLGTTTNQPIPFHNQLGQPPIV